MAGFAQLELRHNTLDLLGYRADVVWPGSIRQFILGTRAAWYFNVLGLLFYTDDLRLATETILALEAIIIYEFSVYAQRLGTLRQLRYARLLALTGESADESRLESMPAVGALLGF